MDVPVPAEDILVKDIKFLCAQQSNMCDIVVGIIKFWSRKEIIVFLIFKIIKNYSIFLKRRILKILSTITQILLLFNILPEMNSIGLILLYKTLPPMEKVWV